MKYVDLPYLDFNFLSAWEKNLIKFFFLLFFLSELCPIRIKLKDKY